MLKDQTQFQSLDPYMQYLAMKLAVKHHTPKATVTHPEIIIPGDEFMTEKLRDPDYVPYCLVTSDCGRVRRVEDGFVCPTCQNKMNYDLTHFNGNINVQYVGPKPVLSVKEWNKAVEYKKLEKERIKNDKQSTSSNTSIRAG